jgi:hypothetical protein
MVIKMVISSANYERWIGLLWKTRWKTMVFTPSSGGSCRFYLKPILGRVLTGSSWGKHVELEKPWGKAWGESIIESSQVEPAAVSIFIWSCLVI